MSNNVFLFKVFLVNILWDALEYVDCFWFRTCTETSPKMSNHHQWLLTSSPASFSEV